MARASRIPATRVRVAKAVTYLMNLGRSPSISSLRELADNPRIEGVRTMARNMAVPIQPMAASMWSQASVAITSAWTKGQNPVAPSFPFVHKGVSGLGPPCWRALSGPGLWYFSSAHDVSVDRT